MALTDLATFTGTRGNVTVIERSIPQFTDGLFS